MSIFSSFRSTVTPFTPEMWRAGLRLLVDPITGAPTGIQNPNGTGADGLWTPVDLTAGQIAAPSAAMIADLNSVFRLNVAPYTRYRSDGTTLVETTSANMTGPVSLGGTVQSGFLMTNRGTAFQSAVVTQPASDTYFTWLNNIVTYTANAPSGDPQGLNSQLNILANGHTIAAGHSAGVVGQTYLTDTNAASIVTWVNGVLGQSGNQGAGTVTNAVDFKGHTDLNSGGGTLTNHYMIWQEISTGATNEYGAYFSAPVGIGPTAPTYNLDMSAFNSNLSSTNWARIGAGNGTVLMTSTGTSIFPGYSPGAGGFGALEIVAGTGAPAATNATTGFLYIPTCAGAPTGNVALAAAGRCAVIYDSTDSKIYFSTGGGTWKGVVVS